MEVYFLSHKKHLAGIVWAGALASQESSALTPVLLLYHTYHGATWSNRVAYSPAIMSSFQPISRRNGEKCTPPSLKNTFLTFSWPKHGSLAISTWKEIMLLGNNFFFLSELQYFHLKLGIILSSTKCIMDIERQLPHLP